MAIDCLGNHEALVSYKIVFREPSMSATSVLAKPVQAAAPRAPLRNRAEALERARELTPRIRARANRAEEDRRIPDETIEELLESGLFHIVTPKIFGGAELGFASLVEVTAEIAAACGSTGWVYGVLAGHSWMLNLFAEETQREILANPDALTATVFRLAGQVTAVEGGYRLVGGEGRFCSGIDFASWVIVGNSVKLEDGTVEPRFFIVPRSDIEVVDDWYTAGMRGTGSRSIRIADAFIPARRSLTVAQMSGGAAPGTALHTDPLYRMSFADVTPFSIVGAPLGMARGAVQLATDGIGKGLANANGALSPDQAVTMVRLAEAACDVDSATAMILTDAEMIDDSNGPENITGPQRARIPRDWAYGVQKVRRAANEVFEIAGGGGIYSTSEIQRFWRDVNAASQHRAFNWNMAMVDYGKTLLGIKAQGYKLKGN
jgi:alkylation response protein AidB-like acyl-CoA dehydrogenase